jgi:hypothetical protein
MSGEIVKTDEGTTIRNFHIAFTSWDNTSIYCIGKDSDGVCSPTDWAPGVEDWGDDDDDDWGDWGDWSRRIVKEAKKQKWMGGLKRRVLEQLKNAQK